MKLFLTVAGLSVALLVGCAAQPDYQIVGDPSDANYLSFDRPFTDKAAADVFAEASRRCSLRQQAAIQTSNVCSLTTCATNYQCVPPGDIRKHGL